MGKSKYLKTIPDFDKT